MLSNDGGFGGATEHPVAGDSHYAWTLASSGAERLPKTVYVRFTGPGVDDTKTFTDDIVLDQTPPAVTSAARTTTSGARTARVKKVRVRVKARDSLSGVGSLQFAAHPLGPAPRRRPVPPPRPHRRGRRPLRPGDRPGRQRRRLAQGAPGPRPPPLARPRRERHRYARSAMDLSLFFAGTAGSVPSARRGLPATLLRRGGEAILFDCGEGTQRQLIRSVGLADVSDVFLTHFHADHWLGLPGMLKSFELRDRDRPLTVHGPPGTIRLLEAVRFVYGKLKYPFEIRELEPGEPVRWEDWYVAGVPGRAPRPHGVRLRDRRGAPARALRRRAGRRASACPSAPTTAGSSAARRVNGVTPEQVIGPDRPGRKLVLSGDTAPCETLRVAAHEADVLVREATFAAEEAERAAQTRHSTAQQAAELARDADVRLLALTHLSARYAGHEIRDEARAVFAPTVVPRDFDTIEVPFPEKGPPELVRWGDRPTEVPT